MISFKRKILLIKSSHIEYKAAQFIIIGVKKSNEWLLSLAGNKVKGDMIDKRYYPNKNGKLRFVTGFIKHTRDSIEINI